VVGGIDHFALPLQRQRLERLDQHFRIDAGGHLDDEVHFAALGDETRPVLRPAIQVDVVEGTDTEAIGLVHHLADLVLGVPLLHDRAVGVVVMGVAVEGVATEDHAADFGAAEFHFGDLDLGGGGERPGLARRNLRSTGRHVGLRPAGLRFRRGDNARQTGSQRRARLQESSARIRHAVTSQGH